MHQIRKKYQDEEEAMDKDIEPHKLQFHNAYDFETVYEKCSPLFMEQTLVYFDPFKAEQGHNLEELLLWNVFNRMACIDANAKFSKTRRVDIYPKLAGLKFVLADMSICYVPILSMKLLNFKALSTTWQHAMERKHVLENYSPGDFQNLLHHSMLYVDVCECSFDEELERVRQLSVHSKPEAGNHPFNGGSQRRQIRRLLANPEDLASVVFYKVMSPQ